MKDHIEEKTKEFLDDKKQYVRFESEPLPVLCLICRNHEKFNSEEQLLCLMNRYDQQGEQEFICGAFKKI